MSDPIRPGPLAKKLAAILGEVANVPKTGYNSFHKYNYVTEADLVDAVRKKLAAANVFVFTSVSRQTTQVVTDEQTQKQTMLTLVETLHTFVDGDSGDSFSVASAGQGADKGDKGVYKAITGAMKYFLYKNFLISTNDDPEQHEDGKKEDRGGAGGKKTPEPAGKAAGNPKPAEPAAPAFYVLDTEKPGDWKNVVVCIEKSDDFGKKLGALDDKRLQTWFDKWNPKGKAPAVLNLRAALDMWAQEKLDSQNGKK